ncbi:flavin reductase family protein [Streptomyces sp. 3214.6]|uniref:flavin reductase family protein n=1 Tax=Streptomyces sp. 3214.6 TaxID=1882757 RepID=UPI000909B0BE|nr:flavin reductase family protein [Streptomyces sp. 3214.6]SHH30489.1 NADH-FMN oxidoreductase RutF, flavin reductase (DIM6/NTAB) family [Streptomyces sp. 3214.6]
MLIDSADLDAKSAYKLLIGSVIPRPIAWVSTVSTEGVANLAPISFFTVVGRKPPRVSLSMQPRSDGVTLKDSFVNIRDTGEFVSNMATLPQVEGLHRSAFDFEPDVDEFDAVALQKEPSDAVRPPRVKGAPIALECTVDRIFSASDGLHHVVWGNVVRFYIRDDLLVAGGRIDFGAIAPVGRLAAEYTLVDNTFVPPLDTEVMRARAGHRIVRLDGKDTDYSPIDTPAWSPSGATTTPG